MVVDGKTVVLGLGCSSGVTFAEFVALADKVLSEGGLERPDAIATLSSKHGDPVWEALAAHYDCALRFYEAGWLEKETPRLATPSETVFRVVGCHGVAEAAALAGVGPLGVLVVTKTISAHASAALARLSGD